MADDRVAPVSDRVVMVQQAPEVVYVEREPANKTMETTIIQSDDRGRLNPSMLVCLVLGFVLVAGLIYTRATSGDEKSNADGMNLSIDVAAPQLPTVTLPALDVDVKAPDARLPDVQIGGSDAPATKSDIAIAPGEPLEPVE